jgi:hypothetical protein
MTDQEQQAPEQQVPEQQAPERPAPPRSTAPEYTDIQARRNRLDRRRNKIAAEIARNRRGDYRVPTWALATVLGLIIAGWLALIIFS